MTCPYRARAHTLAAAWESLGIAVDFMPSALVAPLVGVREFGLGSTLAFRAADLERAGGFAAIAEYLADDYQLAKRITALGKRAVLSTYTVETSLGEATWSGIWQHQLRWARTIRLSKGGGYAGLPDHARRSLDNAGNRVRRLDARCTTPGFEVYIRLADRRILVAEHVSCNLVVACARLGSVCVLYLDRVLCRAHSSLA